MEIILVITALVVAAVVVRKQVSHFCGDFYLLEVCIMSRRSNFKIIK